MPFLTDFSYASSSGQNELHTAICTPEGPPCGVIQIVHGLAEHIGRYSDFMLFLAENGYVSVGNDHLGHGLSAKDSTELGFFAEHNGWNCVVQDTQTLRNMMQARYPDIPYFVFGHSMGGLLAYHITMELVSEGRYVPDHLYLSAITPPDTLDTELIGS